jgi:hypothetical protein
LERDCFVVLAVRHIRIIIRDRGNAKLELELVKPIVDPKEQRARRRLRWARRKVQAEEARIIAKACSLGLQLTECKEGFRFEGSEWNYPNRYRAAREFLQIADTIDDGR